MARRISLCVDRTPGHSTLSTTTAWRGISATQGLLANTHFEYKDTPAEEEEEEEGRCKDAQGREHRLHRVRPPWRATTKDDDTTNSRRRDDDNDDEEEEENGGEAGQQRLGPRRMEECV
jgi:hypothetical protein